jgi:hypothetical protein
MALKWSDLAVVNMIAAGTPILVARAQKLRSIQRYRIDLGSSAFSASSGLPLWLRELRRDAVKLSSPTIIRAVFARLAGAKHFESFGGTGAAQWRAAGNISACRRRAGPGTIVTRLTRPRHHRSMGAGQGHLARQIGPHIGGKQIHAGFATCTKAAPMPAAFASSKVDSCGADDLG